MSGLSQSMRAMAGTTGLDAVADLLQQGADALDAALQASRDHHHELQRIGYALGLTAGADLHRECVPAIRALVAKGIPLDRQVIIK